MKGVEPADLYVVDAAERVERGAVRAAAYTDSCLRRIDEHDHGIHAWHLVDRDLALQQAEDLDTHRRSGRPFACRTSSIPPISPPATGRFSMPAGGRPAMQQPWRGFAPPVP